MDYLRVPVTDEKAPKDRDFELLIQVGKPARNLGARGLVFCCSRGGR